MVEFLYIISEVNLTIRSATPDDMARLLQIEWEAAPKTRLGRAELEAFLVAPPGFFLVAADQRAEGYIAAHPIGHVLSLAVAQDHRRQGIGRALLLQIARICQGPLLVEVRAGNQPALAFYQRLGFQTRAQLPAYYTSGEDGLILIRQKERAPR